jgi:hypothetical protein
MNTLELICERLSVGGEKRAMVGMHKGSGEEGAGRATIVRYTHF